MDSIISWKFAELTRRRDSCLKITTAVGLRVIKVVFIDIQTRYHHRGSRHATLRNANAAKIFEENLI